MAADVSTRIAAAGDHLQLLSALARELERAMAAIAGNDLPGLEDSIASQQELSARLGELAQARSAAARGPGAEVEGVDASLREQIRAAAQELQKLNLRYSILLQHSSRSAALMASLFSSFRGQIQEASGTRLHPPALSCQA